MTQQGKRETREEVEELERTYGVEFLRRSLHASGMRWRELTGYVHDYEADKGFPRGRIALSGSRT